MLQMPELLLALNEKSKKNGITYAVQFNYQYSTPKNNVYCRILLLTYNHSKLISKERLYGGTTKIIARISDLLHEIK